MHVGPRLNPEAVRAVVHPTNSSTSPTRGVGGPTRGASRSGRQRGHVAETFKKMSLDYSGMSAKAWVNLSCVTSEPIARLLNWQSETWPWLNFWKLVSFAS